MLYIAFMDACCLRNIANCNIKQTPLKCIATLIKLQFFQMTKSPRITQAYTPHKVYKKTLNYQTTICMYNINRHYRNHDSQTINSTDMNGEQDNP